MDAGLTLVAISADTMNSHEKYAAKLELPFPLLSDADKTVCRQFDVLKPIVNFITRTVIGVDHNMNIVYRQTGSPPMADVIESLHQKGAL